MRALSAKTSSRIRVALAVFSALLVLLPLHAIGAGDSALAIQSLERWMSGRYDWFAVLHVQWLWVPRLLAYLTSDAASSLTFFRALSLFAALILFGGWVGRTRTPAIAMWAVAILAGNILILHSERSYDVLPVALLGGMICIGLFTSERASHKDLGALLLGLSASVSVSTFVGILSLVALVLVDNEARSPFMRVRTWMFMLAGFSSWFLLECYYFGTGPIFSSLFTTDPARLNGSAVFHIAIVILITINVLLVFILRTFRRPAERTLITGLIVASVLLCFREELDWHVISMFALLGLIPIVLQRSTRPPAAALIAVAANLLLFIALPSTQNEYEYGLASGRRTRSQDEINLNHEFNTECLGIQSTFRSRSLEGEATRLLAGVPVDSSVIVLSHSTDGYFDGGTLGALYPNRTFARMIGRPLTTYNINGGADSSYLKQIFASRTLVGLFDKRLAREFIDTAVPPNTPLRETEHLQAITLTTAEGQHALIDRLIYLYYISVGH